MIRSGDWPASAKTKADDGRGQGSGQHRQPGQASARYGGASGGPVAHNAPPEYRRKEKLTGFRPGTGRAAKLSYAITST